MIFGLSRFLSTPSARRATTVCVFIVVGIVISIHALREEGDRYTRTVTQSSRISIHALRKEGDDTSILPPP